MSKIASKFLPVLATPQLQALPIAEGDSIFSALGKLQGQLNAFVPLYIQDTQPDPLPTKYVWIQTNYNGTPGAFTVWFDGGA